MNFIEFLKKLILYNPPQDKTTFNLEKEKETPVYDVRKEKAPEKIPEISD